MDYKKIFNHIGEALLIFDEKGNIKEANPAALQLYGYTYPEMLTLSGKDIVSESHYYKFLDFIKIFETGEPFSCFSVDKRKDGALVPILVKGYRIELNQQPHLLAVIRDISDVKELENQLKQRNEELVSQNEEYISVNEELRKIIEELNEAKNIIHKSQQEKKLILDSMTEWVALMDLDFNYIWTNSAFQEYTGYSEEEAQKHKCYHIWFNRETPCENCPVIKVIDTHKTQQIQHADPQGRIWLVKTSPVKNEAGILIGVIETGTEITQQIESERKIKESEEKYRNLFQFMEEGFLRADTGGQIVMANIAIAKMLGFQSPDELTGTAMQSLYFNPSEREKMFTELNKQGVLKNYALRLKTTDGRIIWTSSNIRYILDEKGKVAGIEGLIRDITEQKKQEEIINKNLLRLKGITRILQYPYKDVQDFLDFALNEAILLTESKIGYIYFYSEEKQEFILNTWSKEVMKECAVMNPQTVYQLEHTGIWGEAVRQRKTIIVNDFPASNPLKKGTPEGHVVLKKFMTLPVFSKNKIVAVVGVANKESDYDENDEIQLNLLMNSVWYSTEQIKAELALRKREEQYRLLADNSSDVIFMLGLDLKYLFISPSVERLRDLTVSEVLNEPIDKTLSPDSYKQVISALGEELEREKDPMADPDRTRVLELQMYKKDGSLIWTEVTAKLLRNEKKEVIGIIGATRDISERKKIELRVAESEEQYRLLVSQMSQALAVHEIILDSNNTPCDYRFLYLNKSFEKLTGLLAENTVGKTLYEVIPGSEDKWVKIYGEVALTGKPVHFESYAAALDKYFDIIAYQNKPGQFVTIFTDITQRKKNDILLKERQEEIETQNEEYRKLNEELTRARDKARYNEEKFYNLSKKQEALLEAVPEILMEVDANKIYTFANQGGKEFFGEDVIGREASYYFEGQQETYEIVKPLFEGREDVIYVESWQRRKDGEKRLLAWWCKVLKDNKGNITGGISTARDITDIKLEEEKFKIIFDRSLTGKVLTGIDGKLLRVNNAFAEMLGYSIEELQQINFSEITYPDDIQESRDVIQSLVSGKQTQFRFQKRYIHKNGSVVWADVSTILHRNLYGEPMFFITNVLDITERKKQEQELLNAKEKAEESDRLKSAFLANMSHEIRTPMNGIMGFAELLKNSDVSEDDRRRYTDIIIQSSQRLLSIINDILDISKIETGQMEINISKTSITDLLNKLAVFYKPIAEAKGIDCRCSHYDSPVWVKTDELRLYQILNNLLNNAFKFTSSGFVEMEFTYSNRIMKFIVRDSGTGIIAEDIPRIFDRFWQAEKDIMKAGRGGSGLGLAIVKSLVEMMGGKIWVESVYGKGTAFYIEIPAEPVIEPETETIHKKTEPVIIPGNFRQICIADDDFVNYYYLESLLKKTDAVLHYAENGQIAVNICRENSGIDLVILDIRMPVMDGVTALRKIKEIKPGLPVIAYTAYAMKGDREKYLNEGFDEFITKPLDKETLWQVMKNIKK